jgi:uncharacterized phage-associated protein
MFATPPFDPRSICNLMLEVADRDGVKIQNLALQKLLYFAHARYLVDVKRPLVLGYFEAWKYGPVHPAAYRAFKGAGGQPITFRASRQDPLTGQTQNLPTPVHASTVLLVNWVMSTYGQLTPGRLVEVSHAKGSPWDFVVGEARHTMAFGLRISDNVILERFKFHKVSVGPEPGAGEPSEDSPFA